MTDMTRKQWAPGDVVDVSGPAALLRNYLEQRDVRGYLARAAALRPLALAVEVGCGFGRLTPVLAEAATRVLGFERETALVEMARTLTGGIDVVQVVHVETLETLPLAAGAADFVMTFTVLQHMTDTRAEATIAEVKRMAAPHAHLLLVEETDPALEAGDPDRADLGYTRGRPVEWYATRLAPFELIATSRREIEPTYPRPDVGTYMFFGER